MKKNIFLIGFMGSGKSTVAARLSERLSMERVEMDQMIVEQAGMAISDIFAKYGEDHFRDMESNTILALQEKGNTIVSCGGGVVLREANTGYMKQNGCVVLLTAEPETIYERVKDSTERPLLNNNMNVEYIRGMMEKRRERYLAAADLVIVTDGKDVDRICDEIIGGLK